MIIQTRWIVAGILLLSATAAARAQTKPSADLIVTNSRVWTVDAAKPTAEAIAVLGDRIVAVGTSDEVDAWRGEKTTVIDGRERRVLPGFNDSHVHFVSGGQQLETVDLRDAPSQEEFARRIAKYAEKLPEKEWVVGGTWDEKRWSTRELPTKELIDPVTPKTPVFVSRLDGHMGLANSLALRLAGITAKTREPAGGVIVRNAKGEPTGILKDAAMGLVQRVMPPLSHAQRLRFARGAMKHAASLGVTSVQSMSCSYADFSVLAELAESGELTSRVYAAPLETGWRDQAKLGIRRAFGSAYLRLGALKGFADGSLGSSTAYFFEPYADDPGNRGLLSNEMQPLYGMLDRMTRADAAGLQLCIHAIGDRAIWEVLDLFGQVQTAGGPRDRRFRIEHAQHVAPKDFARFRDLGVIASMQPYHAIDDGRWAESRIGPVRAKSTYAFRTFIDADVRLAFGTDWPVAPLNPLFTIYAAVTRATLDGRRNEGWVPEQKISVAETVNAYTLGSAYAEFQENEKGSIQTGRLADLVILDRDIFSIPSRDIRDVKVDMTIVGGKIVWDRTKTANTQMSDSPLRSPEAYNSKVLGRSKSIREDHSGEFNLTTSVQQVQKPETAAEPEPAGESSELRVALAQIAPLLGDRQRNLETHLEQIEAAKRERADLIVFPELSLTGYFLRDMVGEVALNRSSLEIAQLIEAASSLALVAGFVEEAEGHQFYNAAFYSEAGRLVHVHRKVYLPTYGLFEEQRYFSAGKRFCAFGAARLGRVGLVICEDLWHVSTATIMQAEEVDVLVCVINSPARGVGGPKLGTAETYELLARTFAQLLGALVIVVNRVGFEDGLCFFGNSMVAGPDGRIIAQAPPFDECLSIVTCDLAELRRQRLITPLGRDEQLLLTIEELKRIKRRRYET